MKTTAFFFFVAAAGIFYFCFFIAAPAIAHTIPDGPWHDFFGMVIYIVIAWGGGVALPLGLAVTGLIIAIADREQSRWRK